MYNVKGCVIKILKMNALEQVMRAAEASICPPAGVSNDELNILLTLHMILVCIYHFSKILFKLLNYHIPFVYCSFSLFLLYLFYVTFSTLYTDTAFRII